MVVGDLEKILKDNFGYDNFREHQKEIVEHILKGENIFVTLPTGHGKSLCYQLPAVMSDGLTIVISPLIALMRDQVETLFRRGIKASFLDSLQSNSEYKKQLKNVKEGKANILYLSPERLSTDVFYEDLGRVNVNRLVVDEAHCISMWGHDFRPSYLKIPIAKERLGNPPIAAFTATAPVCVRDDIIKNLHSHMDFQIHGDVDRPNLRFKREIFHNENQKINRLLELLERTRLTEEPTLVYFSKIKSLEKLSEIAENLDFEHRIYHGQMEKQDRIESQNIFMEDINKLMFATKAFGMGVDKPNIRNIIHFEVPESLEEYYQEAGRAGRDSKKATCTLLYQYADIRMQRDFVRGANPSFGFIRHFYYNLWSRTSNSEKRKDFPEIFFLRDKFEEEYEKVDAVTKAQALSSVSALEEYGLISTHGNKLEFLKKPQEVKKEFPISEEIVNAKHDYDTQKLKIMLYYATSKENAKKIILRHFRYNTVVENVSSVDFEDFVQFDPKNINKILLALAEKDYSQRYLPIMLSSSKIKSKSSSKGSLEEISSVELAVGINRTSSMGFIRKVPIKARTYLTLTEKGMEKLEEDNVVCVVPCFNYDSLKDRMYNPYEKRSMKKAIRDWFNVEGDWYNPNSCWRSVEKFLATGFEVLNKKITGQRLVADYFKVKENKVRLRDAKDFLNYVFDGAIKY